MNELINDIKANGIQEPLKYVEYNGQMYVVDGHHRLLDAKILGLLEVPMVDYASDMTRIAEMVQSITKAVTSLGLS